MGEQGKPSQEGERRKAPIVAALARRNDFAAQAVREDVKHSARKAPTQEAADDGRPRRRVGPERMEPKRRISAPEKSAPCY